MNAARRILATALDDLAEVVATVGYRVGDVLVATAAEVAPPKPPKKRKPSLAEANEKQELPWYGRIAW